MKPRSRRTYGRRRPAPRPSGPWKHGKIPVIGVVGGIGSGKSEVAALFGSLGMFVLDADKVGHALLDQRPVREQVVERFGLRVLETDEAGNATVDRRVLGSIVFDDAKARKDLESILHPRMRETCQRAIARVTRKGEHSAFVIDAALLYEAGWDSLCDRVVFVDAPRELRLERVSASRGWNDEVLTLREAAQAPLEPKKARADVVIANGTDRDQLRAEVERAWKKIQASRPPRVVPQHIDRKPSPAGPGSGPGPRPGQGPGFPRGRGR
ncbi:MAG: dephospho-CoA kinase [Isosphaeraceae bacterium]